MMITIAAFIAGGVIGASLMLVWVLAMGAREVERMRDDRWP